MEKKESGQRLPRTSARKSLDAIVIRASNLQGEDRSVAKRAVFSYNKAHNICLRRSRTLLASIHSPDDLKSLSPKDIKSLAQELRRKIIDTVGKNGGHLASNLGAVELTIALHRAFSSPQDAIVWDVGHQCYTHKLLTGRYAQFGTLRQHGGISGFTRIAESEHDFFDTGHASTSISSALGLLTAWHLGGRKGKVVAVIGDGALTGGMVFEALSHAGQIAKDLIVVLNDNQMSISKSTGSLSLYLSRLTATPHYQRVRRSIDLIVSHIPLLNRPLEKFIFRFKRSLKGLFFSNNLFTDLGFEYVGPLDGHNVAEMEQVFSTVQKLNLPVVVHAITKKGKGYSPAENDPAAFHGIGPFATSDGTVEKFDTLSFTESFSHALEELAARNEKIVAITAAMSKGTGLDAFARHHKQRFFDVGIAEEHAVTFAGGLAAGGMIPVVAIYSTFIQRSVDQIVHDIALQNRHVVIVLDRAGAVPGDGSTHQGAFDIALLRPVPGLRIISPVSAADLALCLDWAVGKADFPVVLRWPKNSCPSEIPAFSTPLMQGRGILVRAEECAPSLALTFDDEPASKRVLLVCTGGIYSECLTAARRLMLEGTEAEIYVLRFIKPFDETHFASIIKNGAYNAVVCVEDGVRTGGIAEYAAQQAAACGARAAVCAFPDFFLSHGTRAQVLHEAGADSDAVYAAAIGLLKQ